MARGQNFKDLNGQKFDRLRILILSTYTYKNTRWICACDCGNINEVAARHIMSGNIKSCGCYGYEKSKEKNTIHGFYGSKHYSRWRNMIRRCSDLDDPYYGGRGISVCEEWQSFEGFLEFAETAPDGLTIDRIDPDGNYEPSNCQWIPLKEQMKNTRKSLFRGTTLDEVCEYVGVNPNTVSYYHYVKKIPMMEAIAKAQK